MLLRRDAFVAGPADAESAKAFSRIPSGTVFEADVRIPQRADFQRYVNALLTVVADNHRDFVSAEAVKRYLKIRMGRFQPFVGRHPTTQKMMTLYRLESTAFSEMDQIEFKLWFDEAEKIILTELLPDIDSDTLQAECLRMM